MHSKYLGLILVLCFVPVVLLTGCTTRNTQSAGPPPPVPASIAVAALASVPVDIHAVGSVEPFSTVQIKSQVAGELISVHFREGADVNTGDLLFEIDPKPFREALRQAEAGVTQAEALLRQAEANVARDRAQFKNADTDAKRYEELAGQGIFSRSQAEQQRTNADALRASVLADEAAVESARATLENNRVTVARARLDLSYCEIHAPISGRAGNLLVHPGNLVKANGDNAMVVINQVSPVFVSFGVPEQDLNPIRDRSRQGKLAVLANLPNQAGKPETGVLTVIDNTVDATAGAIRLKASFSNAERVLWPGQFVDVVLKLDTLANAVVIPAEAVQNGQKGPFVFVVKSDQSVETRFVTPGITASGRTVIQKGVTVGETVVTDGQLRLFPGARIKPVPASQIDAQPL